MKFWFQILEILKKFQIHGDKKTEKYEFQNENIENLMILIIKQIFIYLK